MILVVMAAGIGSRFGGIKQLTKVGPNGEFLIDYSIYDAIQAGVEKVVFVIKKEHIGLFRDTIGKRIESKIKVEYAFQKIEDIPTDFQVPENRVKPWGTGHALLTAKPFVDKSFMIINADDFYGRDAFQKLASFLKKESGRDKFAMVAYQLKNTLSLNGTVSRGICITQNNNLKTVTERTKIGYFEDKLVYFEEDGYHEIEENAKVSVNLFGFTPKIFQQAEIYFKNFFKESNNLEKDEFYLPTIVQKMIDDNLATVEVLETTSKFTGMTYKEDLEGVQNDINNLIKNGVYPSNLWGD